MADFLSTSAALKAAVSISLLLVGWWQGMMVSGIRGNSDEIADLYRDVYTLKADLAEARAEHKHHNHIQEIK